MMAWRPYYVSTFSGIEAATVAWAPLGWVPVCFSEIDPFPSAVLEERFSSVPNLGDITKIDWSDLSGFVDVVVGGSPCQSFSIAGNREGLSGESRLMWEYVRAVQEIRPEWLVWENVPGALSSSHGEDFRCLLESLDALGYGLAWRVLDAQFFGVAQRRERVFLVGRLGDPDGPCEVLFERGGMPWDSPSSREKRQELAAGAGGGAEAPVVQLKGNAIDRDTSQNGQWACGPDENGAYTLNSTDVNGVLAFAVLPFNTTQITSKENGSRPRYGDPCHPLCATDHAPAICMADAAANAAIDRDLAGTLKANNNNNPPIVSSSCSVRRLTPRECERLQGFPDDWTLIPYRGKPAEECPDTPRYKALGNSMAVPVMRWIGKRIQEVMDREETEE